MMQETINPVDRLPDDELITMAKTLAADERNATARLVTALVEIERRRLYLGQGSSSLYMYCLNVLRMSEDAAYNRCHAVAVGLKFPVILRDLDNGGLTLTTVRLLEPVLTPENHVELLAQARYKTKREVERIVASLCPTAPVDDDAVVTQIAPDRYRMEFTVSLSFYDKFNNARSLLRHAIPDGAVVAIFERALDALTTSLDRTRFGSRSRLRYPRSARAGSRYIPRSIQAAVWRRDGHRCAFVGAEGRCRETDFLELHHLLPFAEGGKAAIENLSVRCRAHNTYEAEQWSAAAGELPPSFRNG